MPVVKVYNMSGTVTGTLELSENIFGIEPNKTAMFEAVKSHLAAKRQGTQSALTRAEVSGGGIKPYRQKGTGRARQGSTRAPQWTHGGIAFAPKPRDYCYTINKKLRRLAIKSALSQKVIDNEIVVVDSIEQSGIKTKTFSEFLSKIGAEGKALIITPEVRETVVKSSRNIPGVKSTIATILSAYDLINGGKIVVDKSALPIIEEVYGDGNDNGGTN